MYAETLLDIAMNHSDSLITKAQNGDNRAQGKLVNLWYKRIYNYAFKYFGDHDEAMDVAQKTFITFHEKIWQLKDSEGFKAWLYRIASNHCHESVRKMNSASQHFASEYKAKDVNREATAAFFNPDKQYQRSELNSILQTALRTLNEEQREVVIMKEYEGLKFKEIAEVLTVSENTVKSRLYYGLGHLKKVLVAKNITTEILQS
ncbi:MAG: RNA polymerase sigma factor [Bacteroidota bacterium]